MVYDKYTYNESARSLSTPRWYNKNPTIDTPLSSETYLGYVRDSRDPQRMGRLLVWIPELTGDANKKENWIMCHYCSPFGGATFPRTEYYKDDGDSNVISDLYDSGDGKAAHRTPEKIKNKYGGRQSYGMWFAPPDVGNEVLVTFINGDINFAVWFGVLFQQDMNHMIPGIAENQIYTGSGNTASSERGPVIEPDYLMETDTATGSNPKKLKYDPLYSGLKYQQGLHEDYTRGQSTSSARRESPSEVFGILTPDGNQFVMDDLRDQELIRLRTRSGAQLLIHQTSGMIYAISRDGKTWIELSNEGNVDIYGAESVSVHAEKANVNVKAGQDINLQAARNINMRSGGDFTIEVAGNFDVTSNQNIRMNSSAKISLASTGDVGISCGGEGGFTSTGTMAFYSPNLLWNTRIGPQPDSPSLPSTYTPSGPSITSGTEQPWVSGDPYSAGENIVPRVPQHEPWKEHQISTTGTNNNVVEGALNPNIPKGSSIENATKPNDITLPNKNRFVGKDYTASNIPEYTQLPDVSDCALVPMNQRQISQTGIDLIKQFEGSSNVVYKDQAGLDTIGVGHLITDAEKASGKFNNGPISNEEVNSLLLSDLDTTQRGIRNCVTQPVTQDQYNALVSMAFNIGIGNFCNSTLVKKINTGSYQEVPNQMMRWTKVRQGGVLVDSSGLTTRRQTEAALFAKAPDPC